MEERRDHPSGVGDVPNPAGRRTWIERWHDLPALMRMMMAIVTVIGASFGAGAGGAIASIQWRGLPDSVAVIRATQRDRILPELEALRQGFEGRAPSVGTIPNLVQRLDRIESRSARNECLLEEIAEHLSRDVNVNLGRCALLGNGGGP